MLVKPCKSNVLFNFFFEGQIKYYCNCPNQTIENKTIVFTAIVIKLNNMTE